jgi:hypothetical protein
VSWAADSDLFHLIANETNDIRDVDGKVGAFLVLVSARLFVIFCFVPVGG